MPIGRPRATEQVGTLSGDLVTATAGDITLYVRTTGNDSNDGLSEGNALLTIQEAVNRVPRFLEHDITIDIGEGNFASFIVADFMATYTGSLIIKGVLGNPTLGGGTTSGTATGGSTSQLIDTGQTWGEDELRGMLVLVGGEYKIVQSNTGNTIDFIGVYSASVSGKGYEILEQKTVINSGSSTRILFQNNIFYSPTVQLVDIATSGATIGIYNSLSFGIARLTRVKVAGAYYGVYIADCVGKLRSEQIYVYNAGGMGWAIGRSSNVSVKAESEFTDIYIYDGCSSYGFAAWHVQASLLVAYLVVEDVDGDGIFGTWLNRFDMVDTKILNSGGNGMRVYQSTQITTNNSLEITGSTLDGIRLETIRSFDMGPATISSNGNYGIRIDENTGASHVTGSTVILENTITVASNGSGGISARHNSVVILTAVSGSNTGYGLEVDTNSFARITSNTSITGSSGDATINRGTTVLDWSDHFGSDGDIAVNADNGCRIERKDS